MRGYLVSGLGFLLGLMPAWAGNSDSAAPVPSTQPSLSASSGQARQHAATQPAAPAGVSSAALVGRVMDRPGGKPIVRAKVRVYSEWTRTSVEFQTDRDGAYGFVPHVPGPYRLMVVDRPAGVWAEGAVIYVTDDPGKYPTGKTSMIRINQGEFAEIKDLPPGKRVDPDYTVEAAVVVPDQPRRLPDLHLTLPQCISGTVRDESNRPVPGATISFLAAAMAPSEIETDANGQYRMYPSPRRVSMNCNGTPDRYYPVEPSGSRGIRVLPGQQVGGTDFSVISAPKVTGEVVFPGGQKAPEGMDIWVLVSWQDARLARGISPGGLIYNSNVCARVKTDANGNFTAYLRKRYGQDISAPEELEFVTACSWSPDGRLGGFARLSGPELPTAESSLSISLSHVGSAVVKVVDPDGRPVTGAKVLAKPVSFSFSFIGESSLAFEEIGQGRYCIERLVPKLDYRYYVKAEGFQDEYPGDRRPIVADSARQVQAQEVRLSWRGKKALPRWLEFADRDQGAIHALGELGPQAAPAVPTLTAILKASPDMEKRRLAAQALGKIGPAAKGAVGELTSAMNNDDPQVARYAAEALGLIGDPRAAAAIEAARTSARIDPQTAAVALWRLKLAARTPVPSTVSAPETPASPAASQPATRPRAWRDEESETLRTLSSEERVRRIGTAQLHASAEPPDKFSDKGAFIDWRTPDDASPKWAIVGHFYENLRPGLILIIRTRPNGQSCDAYWAQTEAYGQAFYSPPPPLKGQPATLPATTPATQPAGSSPTTFREILATRAAPDLRTLAERSDPNRTGPGAKEAFYDILKLREIRDANAVPVLENILADHSSSHRIHRSAAAQALFCIDTPAAHKVLAGPLLAGRYPAREIGGK